MATFKFHCEGGRLVSDPEYKTLANGNNVCNASIAYNTKKGDTEEVSYFDLVAWGPTADVLKDLRKGDRVFMEGDVKQRSWVDKDTGKTRRRDEFVIRYIVPTYAKERETVSAGFTKDPDF